MDIKPRKRVYLLPILFFIMPLVVIIFSVIQLGSLNTLHLLRYEGDYTFSSDSETQITLLIEYTEFPLNITISEDTILFDSSNPTEIKIETISGEAQIEIFDNPDDFQINVYKAVVTIELTQNSSIIISQDVGNAVIAVAATSAQESLLYNSIIMISVLVCILGTFLSTLIIFVMRSKAKRKYLKSNNDHENVLHSQNNN